VATTVAGDIDLKSVEPIALTPVAGIRYVARGWQSAQGYRPLPWRRVFRASLAGCNNDQSSRAGDQGDAHNRFRARGDLI
jgi:hypothetical protein